MGNKIVTHSLLRRARGAFQMLSSGHAYTCWKWRKVRVEPHFALMSSTVPQYIDLDALYPQYHEISASALLPVGILFALRLPRSNIFDFGSISARSALRQLGHVPLFRKEVHFLLAK